MRMIMTAALGLSLLSGTVVFAQNTTDTTAKKHHKKEKKSKSTADTAAPSK
jgi:hypothetical protein